MKAEEPWGSLFAISKPMTFSVNCVFMLPKSSELKMQPGSGWRHLFGSSTTSLLRKLLLVTAIPGLIVPVMF